MNFGYADDTLYVHCAPEGRKIDIIKRNNTVCFQMDVDLHLKEGERACDWSLGYRSVIGWGSAQILDTPADLREGLRIIMSQYSDRDYEFPESDLKGIAVIKIVIDRLTGKQAWSTDLSAGSRKKATDTDTTPVIAGDVLYAASFDKGPVAVR
ncbi:MAG: pyridoxamine 5'-phosphate oxidase family protein, partial [Candidatus Aminicenantes bacterium]|nr:pyridoxamine 5'-phosphate oxidase family protein [Candidatus Aminicenantes bacterium]